MQKTLSILFFSLPLYAASYFTNQRDIPYSSEFHNLLSSATELPDQAVWQLERLENLKRELNKIKAPSLPTVISAVEVEQQLNESKTLAQTLGLNQFIYGEESPQKKTALLAEPAVNYMMQQRVINEGLFNSFTKLEDIVVKSFGYNSSSNTFSPFSQANENMKHEISIAKAAGFKGMPFVILTDGHFVVAYVYFASEKDALYIIDSRKLLEESIVPDIAFYKLGNYLAGELSAHFEQDHFLRTGVQQKGGKDEEVEYNNCSFYALEYWQQLLKYQHEKNPLYVIYATTYMIQKNAAQINFDQFIRTFEPTNDKRQAYAEEQASIYLERRSILEEEIKESNN